MADSSLHVVAARRPGEFPRRRRGAGVHRLWQHDRFRQHTITECAGRRHGGSGTSHSATRAGVSSIVTPFADDQFFWANRLRLTGVAPVAIDGRQLNPKSFARVLDFVSDERVRQRARKLGEDMRAENGVAIAVDVLERMVSG